MQSIIKQIVSGEYRAAIVAIQGMTPGTNMDRDGELISAINELHSARLCPEQRDKDHFAQCATLRLQALDGDAQAAIQLEDKIETSAITADLELEQRQMGQKSIYIDKVLVERAMGHWTGSFSGLVTHLLDGFCETKKSLDN